MLTPEQETWIAHLSDEDTISIIPFDPTADKKVDRLRQHIHDALGTDLSVEHHGASSLGISGQDEIDVYIPVTAENFDATTKRLQSLFGTPRSSYPANRTRFVTEEEGKHIDVFVMNEENPSWQELLQFERYLYTHPKSLEDYRKLKEEGDGLSIREYYRQKIEFINDILSKAASA